MAVRFGVIFITDNYTIDRRIVESIESIELDDITW